MTEVIERQPDREPNVRDALRREILESQAFRDSAEDGQPYRFAAVAVKRFAERGLGAAEAVARELERQKTLALDDKKRMSPEEIEKWERMLTEVETWAATVPNLLQEARVVQYDPIVRDRLSETFQLIHGRDQHLDDLQLLRFRALLGSDKNPNSPFDGQIPPEFNELTSITTTQWAVRERLQVNAALKNPNREADLKVYLDTLQQLADMQQEGAWQVDAPQELGAFILSKIRGAYITTETGKRVQRQEAFETLFKQGRVRVNGKIEKDNVRLALKKGDVVSIVTVAHYATELVGKGLEATNDASKESRKKLNAERATQGLPGATQFALNVRNSMDVWKRLLLDLGGPKDVLRYAKDLGTDVQRFKKDFIEKDALKKFKEEAQAQMANVNDKNEFVRRVIQVVTAVFGTEEGGPIAERLTTRPDEFQEVFDSVMKKMEEGFNAVDSTENRATIDELTQELAKLEKGQKADPKRVEELLKAYGDIILKTGRTMNGIQAWQISENVQRPGGAGPTNNLTLVTRMNGKSVNGWLGTLSPYGNMNMVSYRDKEGRIVLVDPGPSFTEQGWVGHPLEFGKLIAQHAALSLVVSHLWTRIPYLTLLVPGNGLFFKFMQGTGGPVTAIAQAELMMHEAKNAAKLERMKISMGAIEDIVQRLMELQADKKMPQAQKAAVALGFSQKLTYELASLLHVAEHEGDLQQLANGHRDSDFRRDVFLEAHMYSNQLMMGAGFPPLAAYNERALGPIPSPDGLEKTVREEGKYDPKMSPELRQYLEAKEEDRQLEKDKPKIDKLRLQRDQILEETSVSLDTLKREVGKPKAPEKSSMRKIIDGDQYPAGIDSDTQVRELREAADSSEMDAQYKEWTSTPEKKNELIRYALDCILFNIEIQREREKHFDWEVNSSNSVERFLYKHIPGTIKHITPETAGDQRLIIPRDKLDVWNERAKELIRVSMAKVLAAARLLRESPPTDKEIQALMEPEELAVLQRYGKERSIGPSFLDRWTYLRMYADKYAPPERKYGPTESVHRPHKKNANKFATEFKEKDGSPVTVWYSVDMPLPESEVDGSKKTIIDVTVFGGVRPEWANEKNWKIWGAGVFDTPSEPKVARGHVFDLLTRPVSNYEDKDDLESAEKSIDMLIRLFPFTVDGRTTLLEKLKPMYLESYEKQQFLAEVIRVVRANGGEVTAGTCPAILKHMAEYQQFGLFRYRN